MGVRNHECESLHATNLMNDVGRVTIKFTQTGTRWKVKESAINNDATRTTQINLDCPGKLGCVVALEIRKGNCPPLVCHLQKKTFISKIVIKSSILVISFSEPKF